MQCTFLSALIYKKLIMRGTAALFTNRKRLQQALCVLFLVCFPLQPSSNFHSLRANPENYIMLSNVIGISVSPLSWSHHIISVCVSLFLLMYLAALAALSSKMSLFQLVESSVSSLALSLCNSPQSSLLLYPECYTKTQNGLEALPTVRHGHHVRGCEPCVCMCAGLQQPVEENFWRMSQCASELSVWPRIVRNVRIGVCVCVEQLRCIQ